MITQVVLYTLAAVLFVAGHFQQGGNLAIGLVLSGGGAFLLLALFLGWTDSLRFSFKLPERPAPAPLPPETLPVRMSSLRPKKEPRAPMAPGRDMPAAFIPPPAAAGLVLPWGSLIRLGLILAALLMAAWGQSQLMQRSDARALDIGLRYFFFGVVLFIAGLWGYTRENLKDRPLNPKVEGFVFVLIMAFATVLRVIRLDTLPSGVFIDMGFQGLGALRILHEGWRPFHVEETFHAPALVMYQKALWFLFFPNTQWSLNLFYALVGLAGLPLIYWTFRQLAGPRTALLTLYVLSVMRWHINFSRNSFPPIQLPLYMFGTLGFLLHGLRTRKVWPYAVSAVFFAGGLYTYQAYKAFPLLVAVLLFYEVLADGKRVWANKGRILLFLVLSFALMAPILHVWKQMGTLGTREASLSIMAKCKSAHSLKPFVENLSRTAQMWNRQGDPNPRHNIQDHRMLDDVTGALFFLGVFYALSRFWRRKYFWALSGLVVMSLPCLLSTDAAHASRMLGVTPFTAFLAASVLAALWGRAAAVAGSLGEVLLIIVLAFPLYQMANQNIDAYFVEQQNDYGCYREYSIEESTMGKEIAKYKDRYEYFVTQKFFGHFTVLYFTYYQREHVKRFEPPLCVAPSQIPPGRGLMVALEGERTGYLGWLKQLYPTGVAETKLDPKGLALAHFFRVEAADVDAARGLTARFSNRKESVQVKDFPRGLPPGPYQADFKGTLFIDRTEEYQIHSNQGGNLQVRIDGRLMVPGVSRRLWKGDHRLQISWDCPAAVPSLEIILEEVVKGGRRLTLDASRVATFASVRGLKGTYFSSANGEGQPLLEIIEPLLNFTNGNDFFVNPVYVHWTGTLTAPKTGDYTFQCRTEDRGSLKLDGREVVPLGPNRMGTIHLMAGEPHRLDVIYIKTGGWYATFTLKWQQKGQKLDVVPNEAFGPVE